MTVVSVCVYVYACARLYGQTTPMLSHVIVSAYELDICTHMALDETSNTS